MGIVTKFLRLLKPEENDYYNSQTEQAENWEKVDNWAEELDKEIKKKASKTVLGRIIVGDNLTVDGNGKVSGNPPYTHPNGNGNSHLPSGGVSGNFIKWLSAGVGQWANITWRDIIGKPSSFTPSSHTHTGGQITQDTTHRFVNDTEKATWNGKISKGSLPSTVSDAKGLYDLIENNSGLNFDTALLYLNDAGTKYVNKIYFDRNKKGMFKCISQTTATTNSTSYFVDISNEANADQLRNLSNYELLYKDIAEDTDVSKIYNYKFVQIVIQASTRWDTITHEQYTYTFNPRFGFNFNNNLHSLGSIIIAVNADGRYDKNIIYFNGTALGKFKVKSIYGFN